MGRIEAIIFDLDGVLVDAREWHYDSLNRALALFGFEITRGEHESALDGLPTREKLAYLTAVRAFPPGLHRITNELKQVYTRELIAVHCHPVFTIEHALASLRAEGYRLAVCSNSVRASVDLMLDRSSIQQHFEFTLSNEDVETAKPSPAIFLEASRRLDVPPERCLVIEDSPHGLAAARSAGARVMHVADPTEVRLQAIRDFIRAAGGMP